MEGRAALWVVAGPLIALKVWATVLLFLFAPTRQAIMLALGTTWPWLVALAVLVCTTAPVLWWYRLLKARAKRDRLRRAEWMLTDAPPARTPGQGPDAGQWPAWVTVVRSDERS